MTAQNIDGTLISQTVRSEVAARVKARVEAGLAAREELYQAELDMTSSKSNVQNDQTELENFLDSFITNDIIRAIIFKR